MNKVNYQKILEKTLDKIKQCNNKPKLLLHCCCAPCTSYVLDYLKDYFCITLLFYNPNITSEKEYNTRAEELKKLVTLMNLNDCTKVVICDYSSNEFYEAAKGLEQVREGGERCFKCYRLRLEYTATMAQKMNYDYFCTTLSISPLKNADKLNEIGIDLSKKYGVEYLLSDFKKKEGYKQSIILSQKYDLYRQNYCGCIFSQNT